MPQDKEATSSPKQTSAKVGGTYEERLTGLGFDGLENAGPEVLRDKLNAWAQDFMSMSSELDRELYFEFTKKKLKGVTGGIKRLMEGAIEDARPKDTEAGESVSGSSTLFSEIEPWENEVELTDLLDVLADTFKKYLVLPPGASDTLALWVVFTYCFEAFDIFPYLNVTSVSKQCGKTTLANVATALIHRPLSCSHATGPALFRVIEASRPTLVIDEADTFLKHNKDTKGILNSGHTRGGGVLRCEEVSGQQEVRFFSTWGPKIVLGIGRLDDTLEDRSIILPLKRKTPDETVESFRITRLKQNLSDYPRQMARWAEDNFSALEESDPEMPALRSDRGLDNWRPLISIADLAGEEWAERARKSAELIDGATGQTEDQDKNVSLLHDTVQIIQAEADHKYHSKPLANALNELENRPWGDWNYGKGLTANTVAKRLSGFGIKPKKVRRKDKNLQGYELSAFEDAIKQYPLPPSETEQSEQPNKDGHKPATTKRNNAEHVPAIKSTETSHTYSTVPGVPAGADGAPETTASDGQIDLIVTSDEEDAYTDEIERKEIQDEAYQ